MNRFAFFLTDDYRAILGYALAAVFFYYLILFACVAPSAGLIGAVVFELVVYFVFLAYRLKRRKAKSVHARQIMASALLYFLPAGHKLARATAAVVALGGTAVLFLSLVDAVSFGLAASGNIDAAASLYRRLPVSMLAGVNPAYTMELLSGAKLKAGKLDEVGRIYGALYKIRADIFGERSEPICNILADFGDLAERRGQYEKAVEYYTSSVKLSNEIKVPQGCGKFLTKLGAMEAEHGDVSQGLQHLEEALAMRSKVFGKESGKVAETLIAMARVRFQTGQKAEAETLYSRALSIHKRQPKDQLNLAFYSALITVFFMSAGYISTMKNGCLTKLALAKLESVLAKGSLESDVKVTVERDLFRLREYACGMQSEGNGGDKFHELTHPSALFISLASQDLR